MSDHAHCHPAIYGDLGSCNEVIFGQGGKHGRYLLRTSFAMKWYAVSRIILNLLWRKIVLESGADDSGRDAVYTDVAVSELSSQSASELGYRPLSHTVRDCTGTPA